MRDTCKKEEEVLGVDARRDIYRIVLKYAGCHFREIERKAGLSTGSVQYHLGYLVKKGLLKVEKEGSNSRYFPVSVASGNKKVLGLLRQKSVRQILLFILKSKKCHHKDLVVFTGLSASTVSWHLRKLDEAKVITAVKKGRETSYSVVDVDQVIGLLVTYKTSFVDVLVDNVVDMWEK
jgi:predicted transcriptional regulator